jgi:hypothetical protein
VLGLAQHIVHMILKIPKNKLKKLKAKNNKIIIKQKKRKVKKKIKKRR